MKEKKLINVQIGNQIRLAREQAGLTQDQFGEIVSLGSKNISDIERGIVGISVSTLKRICEKLPISSDMILFGAQKGNDVEFIIGKIRHLPPKKFTIIKELLNKIFEVIARLEH